MGSSKLENLSRILVRSIPKILQDVPKRYSLLPRTDADMGISLLARVSSGEEDFRDVGTSLRARREVMLQIAQLETSKVDCLIQIRPPNDDYCDWGTAVVSADRQYILAAYGLPKLALHCMLNLALWKASLIGKDVRKNRFNFDFGEVRHAWYFEHQKYGFSNWQTVCSTWQRLMSEGV